ncbi:hypothetical protein [Palleronia abyssalis]|uniref:Uncharacterized protein n=1 Tax=Palleronia abyssalis TaxID=1501240 RepID=A0A2R8C1F9_9RHOB|nr:hypothetical protein [Palleronia abyssalis]SPJ26146.1 hypothetical protein PAA8504_04002 [Palleronia abyssalis]
MELPDTITHYHSRSDRPFQNLSDLPPDALAEVLAALKRRKARDPAFRRVFGGRYMEFRRRTEDKMRTLFEARGGKPDRRSPHYFVLGDCPWFAGLYPDTGTVTLDWRSLPRAQASFTYPDSFVAMRLGPEYGLPPEPVQPYHDRVFFLDELAEVVAAHGLPDGAADADYEGYHARRFETYIEVQVWADHPVAGIA